MLKVSGLEALSAVKAINPAIPVIIMTAFSSVETAVTALKQGANDYLTKPLDFDKLRVTIAHAMEHTRLREENRQLRERLGQQFDRHHIIGRSPAMITLPDTVAQVAPSEATVLISGESGTGKDLIAGAIHANSARHEGPFVKLNCAAIAETLMESELFGLTVPPLRDRRDDIPLLAGHFLGGFARQNRKAFKGFTPQAMNRLVNYGWPGNVRERMNAAERAVVLGSGDFLTEEDFPTAAGERKAIPGGTSAGGGLGMVESVLLETVEKEAILQTLAASRGNKSEAARRLGITRRTLHKKLKRYGVMK